MGLWAGRFPCMSFLKATLDVSFTRSCSGVPSCLSSYDDGPSNFLPPWQYSERTEKAAMARLRQAVEQV